MTALSDTTETLRTGRPTSDLAITEMLTTPWDGVPEVDAAPEDLAEACLWAARRRPEIDRLAKQPSWGDDEVERESVKCDAVFVRAIGEPSRDARDVIAKAALALEDFERFRDTETTDKDIVHTVLKEVSALQIGDEDLIQLFDPSPLSMKNLRVMADVGDLISEMAAALACQPRCAEYEGVEALVERVRAIGDQASSTARREAAQRKPVTKFERVLRLVVLAGWTLDNGEPTEVTDLARDISQLAEA